MDYTPDNSQVYSEPQSSVPVLQNVNNLTGLRPKPAACRCLFGRPTTEDSEITKKQFRDFIERDNMRLTQKYNFNFKQFQPLQGQYSWSRVDETNSLEIVRIEDPERRSEEPDQRENTPTSDPVTSSPYLHQLRNTSTKRRHSTLKGYYRTLKTTRRSKQPRRH